MTVSRQRSSVALIRRLLEANEGRPLPELLYDALDCLVKEFDARTALIARIEDHTLEVVEAVSRDASDLTRGLSLPLEEAFNPVDAAADGIVNVRDASKAAPFAGLPMQARYQIQGYLGVPVGSATGRAWGTLAVIAKGPRSFTPLDVELVRVIASLLAQRLGQRQERGPADRAGARTPISMLRLASQEVQEPLKILRGYAELLSRNEVPEHDLPMVAQRLLTQSETVIRTVDQVLIMARLPMDLAFTVRVPLQAVAQSVASQVREAVERHGMELRLQLDTQGEVWGDATLLEAALDEMVHNVFHHAPQSTVIHLRLRGQGRDRLQLIVKDDGPGMSADRLAQLFAPLRSEQDPPVRGQGMGLYLLRRVAEAHGGSTWANSLEGKGTTFYLELPAASPDGDAVRASQASQPSSA
ncbi:MAG TPA: GAF domain-containing sensor histidine kinase [Candidatus Limnocylindrales bacterium]|nr:GAF domain-containing sensor histidine kinase [Candidatus Limnocylindrales bacterium]